MSIRLTFDVDDKSQSETEKTINAIKYLKSLDPKRLIDYERAYEAVYLIEYVVFRETTTILNENCEHLFATILLQLNDACVNQTIDFTNFKIKTKSQRSPQTTRNDRYIGLLAFTLNITNILAYKSTRFNVSFTKSDGLRAHIAFLNNSFVLNQIIDVNFFGNEDEENAEKNNESGFVYYVVSNLEVFSRCFDRTSEFWLGLDGTNTFVVKLLLEIVKRKPETELEAFLVICNIADYDQLGSLGEMWNLAQVLSDIVKQCAEDLSSVGGDERAMRRIEVQTLEDESRVEANMLYVKLENGCFFSFIDILKCLYKLAANEKLRKEIDEKQELTGPLELIVKHGNEFERNFATKLLKRLLKE